MALVMETFNSASIGLSKLHFAKMTDKGSATAYPSYGAFVRIDGLVNGTITQNGGIESDYADNKTHETAVNYGAADISLEVTGLGPAGYEFITNRIVNDGGGSVMMAGSTPETLACAFEVLNANGKRVRYVIYDSVFFEGEISLQTKADGIEFSHTPLEGRISEVLYDGKIKRKSDGELIDASGIRFMTMTEDGEDYDEDKWNNWFFEPQYPWNNHGILYFRAETSGEVAVADVIVSVAAIDGGLIGAKKTNAEGVCYFEVTAGGYYFTATKSGSAINPANGIKTVLAGEVTETSITVS